MQERSNESDNLLLVFLTRVIKHWNRLLMDVVHATSMRLLKIESLSKTYDLISA